MKASTPLVPPRPPLRPHFQTGRARFLLALVSAGAGVDGPVGGLGGCAEHRRLRGAPSAAFPPRPTVLGATTGAGGTPRRTPGAGRRRPRPAPCGLSVRGFGAQDGGSGHRTGSLPPSSGGRPRPEGRTPVQRATTATYRRRPLLSPGLTHGLTRVTPRPRTRGRGAGLRTCARVADVPPGRVGNPGARPHPSGTSTTRRVPRAGSATYRSLGRRRMRNEIEPRPIRAGAPSAPASGLEPLTVR